MYTIEHLNLTATYLDSPGRNTHSWSIVSDSSHNNNNKPNKQNRNWIQTTEHRRCSHTQLYQQQLKFNYCQVCVCEADCLVCLSSHCAVKDLTRRSRPCCCNTNTTFHHFVNPSQNNPAGRKTQSERGSCVRVFSSASCDFYFTCFQSIIYLSLCWIIFV